MIFFWENLCINNLAFQFRVCKVYSQVLPIYSSWTLFSQGCCSLTEERLDRQDYYNLTNRIKIFNKFTLYIILSRHSFWLSAIWKMFLELRITILHIASIYLGDFFCSITIQIWSIVYYRYRVWRHLVKSLKAHGDFVIVTFSGIGYVIQSCWFYLFIRWKS